MPVAPSRTPTVPAPSILPAGTGQTGHPWAPVLPGSREGLTKKVKPFCRIYERESATYALVRGIDYIYDECPHAVGNLTNFYKTLLNQLESQSPGAKLGFYLEFLRARGDGAFEQFNRVETLHECEVCGQPTSAPGRWTTSRPNAASLPGGA